MQIDVPSFVGAVVRRVEDRERDGRPVRVVIATRRYDTGIDDLWDALTNPERLPRWFLPVSGELRLGGRYQLQGNAGGTITECAPPRRLAVTWEFGGQVSWVNVTLASEGARTRLELEHIAPAPDVNPFWDQYGPGAVGVGWDLALVGMALHLASDGAAVDPAEVVAWTASAEGKAFIAGSSDGWRIASVAYGTPQPAATAAAAETTKFYMGS